MSRTTSTLFTEGGPPDPINFLRSFRGSFRKDKEGLRRSDSADDVSIISDRKESIGELSDVSSMRVQEPPARQRPDEGTPWPYRDHLSFTRTLIFYGAGSISPEHEHACKNIQKARDLRQKYFGSEATVVASDEELQDTNLVFEFGNDGVVEIFHAEDDSKSNNLVQVPNIEVFNKDYHDLAMMSNEGSMRSYCFQRLQLLTQAYRMHITMNGPAEAQEQSNLMGTDFYRVFKIDNHIHAAAAPTAKQFVNFVTRKLEEEPDTVVSKDGKTLGQVFEEAGIQKDSMTIDAFNVLADYSVYQRFDNFNAKYSPFRMADMRRIFLKVNNHMGGRYFAELMKNVLSRHEEGKGHKSGAEMRLSIYGMERHEWDDLAEWMLNDWEGDHPGPVLSTNNRWLIQIPRLWRIFSCKPGSPCNRSFLDMLQNIFVPMFEATLYPEKHPKVAECLTHIVGFDSVDDEGSHEESGANHRPQDWTKPLNPAYWWQLYYLWANLEVLNKLRKARGLNTIAFRPHAGETGNPNHLACTYLLCESINHGINLDMQVSLQYLYYLDQIGMSISPLSNNFLFRRIAENPFQKFFRRGLNVTLSTDDPLLFHMSDDALLEEYSVARATFDLSMTDLMEIARNSILQSGFEEEFKEKYLGKEYRRGVTHCDEQITHVPLIRAKFRAEHLALEHMLCHLIAAGKGNAVLEEMKIQFGLARDAHRNVLFENLEEVPHFPERGQL
eukprot:Nitzschia sp. Nitz4//scaffold46_size129759//23431//25833//NITZ4_003486-RA/size129759-snap-gene-0.4-mRNA-1//1//CDS//3329552550//7956//frame0